MKHLAKNLFPVPKISTLGFNVVNILLFQNIA